MSRKTELHELGYDKYDKRWFIKLRNMGEIAGFGKITGIDVISEAYKDEADSIRYSIVERSGFRIISKNILMIDDIVVVDRYQDRGIGTLILKFIEKLSRSQGITKLHGEISARDSDHIKKLIHFYGKSDFNFTPYEPPKGIFIAQVEKLLA
jgi:GNAT superfamily N-acetyltransferase